MVFGGIAAMQKVINISPDRPLSRNRRWVPPCANFLKLNVEAVHEETEFIGEWEAI